MVLNYFSELQKNYDKKNKNYLTLNNIFNNYAQNYI